jgi:pimeloyl-ACP methyl ester carboxylesterase
MRRESARIRVRGGRLQVTRWPGRHEDSPVVLAVHGITANSRAWDVVARQLDGEVTIVAPDLRGRGFSASLPGPYGMAEHAADLVAVLDHLGVARALVLGHSMGGFVACVAAVRHPDRFSSVVLVDGGVRFPVPQDLDAEAALHAVIGPALARLEMTFASGQAYRTFWQAHPAFAASWSADVDTYVQYDLVGEPPRLRSSCSVEAVRHDGRELLHDTAITSAVRSLPCPAILLWAERGLQDEPQGLYDERRLAAAGLDPSRVDSRRIDDVNHYTALLTPRGASAVAAAVLDAARASMGGPAAVEGDRRAGEEGRHR